MNQTIDGSCLCGKVRFRVPDAFRHFHLCHCRQCQKISGGSHVANLFTGAKDIQWLEGQDKVVIYTVPGRDISNAFCRECGCALPYTTGDGRTAIVPAGSLDGEPTIKPSDHIYYCERAAWYDAVHEAPTFDRSR